MANKLLGKFQMLQFNSWKGITSDNHLGAMFKTAPQKLAGVMVELLATKRGATLDSMLSKFPTKEFESDEEYTWDIVGSHRRNIPLLEARDEDGVVVTADYATNVGINTSPFYLVFAEDWFADGEVIHGNLNELYPIRILAEPRFEGSNAVYKCELFSASSAGIPVERLLMGERFSVGYAPVEKEMSRKVGDIRFATPVAMRNEFSRVRIQHKVSGSKLDKKLAVGLPIISAVEGKTIRTTMNTWMHYVQWELEKQFSEYKNNILAFGRSNRNENGEYMNFGKSGNAIQMGDGLFAQIEVSNTIYYNRFSLKLLEEALLSLSTSKLDFGERVFVMKTGEAGAVQFHKAILNEVSGWTAYTADNPATVTKTSSNLHSNALAAGFQFTEYRAPNGVVLKLDVDRFYDDAVQHKMKFPGTNNTAYSYRYDIFFLGNNNDANIFKVGVKGRPETRSIEPGIRDPYTGKYSVMFASHDEDSSTMHMMAVLGICVLDPTKSVSFIPAILQG